MDNNTENKEEAQGSRPVDVDSWDPDKEPRKESQEGPAETDAKAADFAKKFASTVEKATMGFYNKTKGFAGSMQFKPRAIIERLDAVINWLRSQFPPETYEKVSEWFSKYGHAGLLCAQVLTVIFFLISAAVVGQWTLVAAGFGICVLLVILQYTAEKFLRAGDTLVKSSPSRLSSAAFLDCLALLLEVAGIMALVMALMEKQLATFIVGLGVLALCDVLAYIALNPSLVNITVSPAVAAGEEAIGILSFAVKAVVRMVPIAFGIGAIVGTVALAVATVSVIFTRDPEGGYKALKLICACSCLPFASYVVFTIYHLIIDIIGAILKIPGKIDELIGKKGDGR